MVIGRLYTGDDGESHFEEWDLKTTPGVDHDLPMKSAMFRRSEPGRFSDWHNAPRRQYIITLSGEVEIGLRDGNLSFGTGDVILADDLTGEGHTTAVPGSEPWIYITVALDD